MRPFRVLGLWGAIWIGTAMTSALLVNGQERITAPGDPLPGLTPVEALLFHEGLDVFLDKFEDSHGLGPAFNGASCSECHSIPAVGGGGVVLETHAAYRDVSGDTRALNSAGDTLVHLFSVAPHTCQPLIPRDANVVAHRASIPLFGAGLVEAIPDDTLLALEDPADLNRDGVSGRAPIVTDLVTRQRRVGRFGWKGQHASLVAFAADAFRNEMGIPNPVLNQEYAFGFNEVQMQQCNAVRGIAGLSFLDGAAMFMRLLAPAERGPIDDAVQDGERVFNAIGCAVCHVPGLTTGPATNPLFDRKLVRLFSDLLLHDVGTGDGIPQASARPEEIRTPALWGLRLRRPFLHDGSASTIEDAIQRHGREAELAQRGFVQLFPDERASLLAFLRSL